MGLDPTPSYRRAPRLAAASMLLVAATLPAASVAAQENEPDPSVLTVSGSAEVSVSPDRASVSFAVVTEGDDAASAARENAESMTAVTAALRATELPGLELETWGYVLRPRYRAGDGPGERILIGYQVTNNIRVRIDDVDAVGGLLDTGIEAGANQVTALSFEASDTDAARDEALALAVAEARRQAQVIADALGLPLGHPLEVQSNAAIPGPRAQYARIQTVAMEARADTPIEAGDQLVRAQVTIRYRLETGSR